MRSTIKFHGELPTASGSPGLTYSEEEGRCPLSSSAEEKESLEELVSRVARSEGDLPAHPRSS